MSPLNETNSNIFRRFSFSEIQNSTNNFDNATVIGRGGFGNVYKGFINDGTKIVAIKRLNTESKQGELEFHSEINTLSKLSHINLITLIGYCDEDDEKILIYEYMPNGTLADHLYKYRKNKNNSETHPLTWEERLKICIGAARGLDYLHTNTELKIIHRDVKTTNILLDTNWVPKISDFGLSKMGTNGHRESHVSTQVKGTFGYLDPTYFLTSRLTVKSDVYAFGVILFEVLCGKPSLDLTLEEDDSSLILWAQHCIKKGVVNKIIDPFLKDQISTNSLKTYVEVAKKCLHSHAKGRPSMDDVARRLEIVLNSVKNKPQRDGIITILPLSVAKFVAKVVERGWSKLKGFNCKSISSPFLVEAYQSCRRFSIAEIKSITNNFDNHLVVGENDYTKIYKTRVEPGKQDLAVKRWKNGKSKDSRNLFNTEVKVVSHVRHLHIVSLVGYCEDRDELIVVYEYMINGSLFNHLYKSNHDTFSWEQRLEISIGAARGLQYLHAGATHPIIHRNLKLTSILLDKNRTAKIGGLSFPLEILDNSPSISFDSHSIVEGEIGYICPEYIENGRCSIKSDIYSFGVILLELLCRRRPMMINLWNMDQVNLVRWFKTNKEMDALDQIIDPYLKDKIAPECLKEYINIIENCVSNDGSIRPCMEDVLHSLRCSLQIQQKWKSLNRNINISNVFDEDSCKEDTDGVSFRNLDDSDYLSVNLAR